MNEKEFLILTKGRAVCLMLDTAVGILNEISFKSSSAEDARRESVREIFYVMTQVASLVCGKSEWNGVYDFLVEIGITVPEDFHLQMSYVDSMLDIVPGEMKCN